MRSLLLSLLVVGFLGPAAATTIYVPEDYPTIQAGIDAASAGDEVVVACGTYFEHDIVMKSGVWLRSATGEPDCVTVDAQGLGRGIYCYAVDATAVIEGLRFTGGDPQGENWGARGGAMALFDSSPRIRSCVFSDNRGTSGGGGIAAYRSASVIEGCVFARNSGIDGGGIYLDYASPAIDRCLFHDNGCLFWGGAVFCENESSPSLTHCTLVRNDAYQGGGIWCVNRSNARLENCLVAFSTQGEGVYAWDDPWDPSEIAVACSDVYGNAGGNYGGALEDQTGVNGNISSDPIFCKPDLDDFSLESSSPCLPENNSCGVLMGALGQGCSAAGIADQLVTPGVSDRVSSSPNPFGSETEIRFLLPAASRVTLRIFDPEGRRVRELAHERLFQAGAHAIRWDGRDDVGRVVASSVYLCRFQAEGRVETHRIALLR